MALLNVNTEYRMNSYFQQQSGNKKVSTELAHFSVTVSATNTGTAQSALERYFCVKYFSLWQDFNFVHQTSDFFFKAPIL